MNDPVERERILKFIKFKLKEEEGKLERTKSEYRKRVISYSIVLLRDLYEAFEYVGNY